jgi:hypothetical protein
MCELYLVDEIEDKVGGTQLGGTKFELCVKLFLWTLSIVEIIKLHFEIWIMFSSSGKKVGTGQN